MIKNSSEPKKSNPIFGFHIYRILGIKIAKLLSSTSVTPNQITASSLLLTFLAGFLFLGGTHIHLFLGAITLYMSKLLDYTDGELARIKNIETKFGDWFDGYSGVYETIIPLITIGIGGYLLTNKWIYLILGFTSSLLFMIFMVTRLMEIKVLKENRATFQITDNTHLGWTTPLSIIIILFALLNQPYYLLWFLSTFGGIPVLLRIYVSYKVIRMADKKTDKN